MIYIVIAAVCYAITAVLLAVSTRNIHPNLTVGVSNLLSALIPIAVAFPLLNKNLLNNSNSKLGVLMAVLAGIFIALFSMALAKSYSVNRVAIVAPLVFGGAIFLSAILSSIFLKEKITFIEGFGLLILGVGLAIITYARLAAK